MVNKTAICKLAKPATCEYHVDGKMGFTLCGGNDDVKKCPCRELSDEVRKPKSLTKYEVTADCKDGTVIKDTIQMDDNELCEFSVQCGLIFEMTKRYPKLRQYSAQDIIWKIVKEAV
jgi:hypothetical protein